LALLSKQPRQGVEGYRLLLKEMESSNLGDKMESGRKGENIKANKPIKGSRGGRKDDGGDLSIRGGGEGFLDYARERILQPHLRKIWGGGGPCFL